MEELESTLESKQGLLSELEEWCEQLKAKVEKMQAEEAETGEDLKDEIATMNDELEAVQMKVTLSPSLRILFDPDFDQT